MIRWVKFEQDSDMRKGHYSKPNVSVVAFKAVETLKDYIRDGIVLLDNSATTFNELTGMSEIHVKQFVVLQCAHVSHLLQRYIDIKFDRAFREESSKVSEILSTHRNASFRFSRDGCHYRQQSEYNSERCYSYKRYLNIYKFILCVILKLKFNFSSNFWIVKPSTTSTSSERKV